MEFRINGENVSLEELERIAKVAEALLERRAEKYQLGGGPPIAAEPPPLNRAYTEETVFPSDDTLTVGELNARRMERLAKLRMENMGLKDNIRKFEENLREAVGEATHAKNVGYEAAGKVANLEAEVAMLKARLRSVTPKDAEHKQNDVLLIDGLMQEFADGRRLNANEQREMLIRLRSTMADLATAYEQIGRTHSEAELHRFHAADVERALEAFGGQSPVRREIAAETVLGCLRREDSELRYSKSTGQWVLSNDDADVFRHETLYGLAQAIQQRDLQNADMNVPE